jgi:thioesterase domain-containing protein
MPTESPEALIERYLHEQIPLSAAMGVRVAHAAPDCVRLTAPLAANINHNETVFGGSAASVATLAAWALLHLRLTGGGLRARVVIQHSRMAYQRPIPGDFEARCHFADAAGWERFLTTLARRGRARITLTAELLYREERMSAFEGKFVAIAPVG